MGLWKILFYFFILMHTNSGNTSESSIPYKCPFNLTASCQDESRFHFQSNIWSLIRSFKKMLIYVEVVLYKSLNINVVLIIPKRIDSPSTKTQPGKIDEKLKEKINLCKFYHQFELEISPVLQARLVYN